MGSEMPERKVIGALPRAEQLQLDIRIKGYNLASNGVRVSEHSEIVTLRELPDFVTGLEVLIDRFLIASIPFAVGGGYWLWVPPVTEEDDDT